MPTNASNKAGKLWGKLRKVIKAPDAEPAITASRSSADPTSLVPVSHASSSSPSHELELEDIQLMEYWSKIEDKLSSDLV